ncbi:hypothetical protein Mapa_000350 [Marchantia paleacea]|nr:hypothetical protein Mapa_000348 [Marchantia paleacea]KAG6558169.1 hypothetical protein Mapa_000350 [Marchantia paleacea]
MAYGAEMILLTAILLVSFKSSIAEEFIVGGDSGWVLPVQANAIGNNYTTWADSYNFTVGDSLVFTYNKESHSVLQVSGTAFADCTTSDPIKSWKDGNTTVSLTTEGRMWFICGTPGHCLSGQKFKITVLASAAPASGGEAIPPAPAPSSAAGNVLFRPSKTAVIIGSILAGTSYLF